MTLREMTSFVSPSPVFFQSRYGSRHRRSNSPASWRMCEGVDLTVSPLRKGTLAEKAVNFFNDTVQPLPPPVQLLSRPTIELPFAVALMRSGYNAVDALDIVAMDEFQKEFFDIRIHSWEKYLRDNPGIKQGQLSNAKYFDFISYVQMNTTLKFIREPLSVFSEKYADADGDFQTRVIRRDESLLPTSGALLEAFQMDVGHRIVNTLELSIPTIEKVRTDYEILLAVLSTVYTRMERDGFCLRTKFGVMEETNECQVEMVAPATLWGARALRKRRGIPTDYDVWIAKAMLPEFILGATVVDTLINDTSIIRKWRLRANA